MLLPLCLDFAIDPLKMSAYLLALVFKFIETGLVVHRREHESCKSHGKSGHAAVS
ncbi:MAG TPA: hypothetical protein VGE76_23780 [Opitutaceae bacterium]